MKHSGEFVFVYTTLPNEDAAMAIARRLVERRLSACCNVLPPMRSVYRWENAVHVEPEIAMLIKTRRDMADAAIQAVRPLHPYAVPCFLTLPIEAMNAPYRAWALAETESPI